jgi:predicted enzyme related to lactoylglutathione lyase
MARLNYVELPASDLPATRSFYEQLFDWSLTQFGPSYAATLSGDTDIGLQVLSGVVTTRAPGTRRSP